MSEENDWVDDLFNKTLPGIPNVNWSTQTWLLALLRTSTIDDNEELAIENQIIEGDFTVESLGDLIGRLKINQQHFSNIPNPSQKQLAKFIQNISKNDNS
tara:strand:- start:1022 stop:1321 length:300 start_codon:yes stop_codon:yes gene_type:complete